MSEQENVEIVQQLYADVLRGNIPDVLNFLADDVEWKEPQAGAPPFAGTRRGRDQVAEFFKHFGKTVELEQFEPREYIAQGDQVVALGYYRVRWNSTGRTSETDWAMVWTFRVGKVAKFQAYTDSAAEVAALGRA